MELSHAEEKYVKAIFKISERDHKLVQTNGLAAYLDVAPASITDMLKKLAEKGLVQYQAYKGVQLSPLGIREATKLIRKHRLWEYFLADRLRFPWHLVHDLAEQLEHIKSDELIQRLDAFLDYPKFDPHGDPIPNPDGKFTLRNQFPLADGGVGETFQVVAVRDQSNAFLAYLSQLRIKIGSKIIIRQHNLFEQTLIAQIDKGEPVTLTSRTTTNVMIKKI